MGRAYWRYWTSFRNWRDPSCQENAKMILQRNDSREVSFNSFDLKQTKSSTPLLPDRPSSGSDDLFSVSPLYPPLTHVRQSRKLGSLFSYHISKSTLLACAYCTGAERYGSKITMICHKGPGSGVVVGHRQGCFINFYYKIFLLLLRHYGKGVQWGFIWNTSHIISASWYAILLTITLLCFSRQSNVSRRDIPSLDLQTHGQCTDEMDTQPPLLYMDPGLADQAIRQKLEQISDSEDDDSQQVSVDCSTHSWEYY